MPSELDSTSGDPGRALPVRPWWLVAALAALALAWWVFRPERANPLPRDESRGDVQAAPGSHASFEYYEGMLEGDAADPALAPSAPAATQLPVAPPARGRGESSKVKSSDNASPGSNVPRDVAVLPPNARFPRGAPPFAPPFPPPFAPPFACSDAQHGPPPGFPWAARPRPVARATSPAQLAP